MLGRFEKLDLRIKNRINQESSNFSICNENKTLNKYKRSDLDALLGGQEK
jgi:hypothetical protein